MLSQANCGINVTKAMTYIHNRSDFFYSITASMYAQKRSKLAAKWIKKNGKLICQLTAE